MFVCISKLFNEILRNKISANLFVLFYENIAMNDILGMVVQKIEGERGERVVAYGECCR